MKKICMVGTGYVGLVTGSGLADIGHKVICCDINKDKINKLNQGLIPIFEPGLSDITKKNFKVKRLSFSSDIQDSIKKSDIIFIAVGTPEKKNGEADITAVKAVANSLKHNLNKYKLICIKSTVPLETYDLIKKILLSKNNKSKFDLVANPEFLREGSSIKDFFWPDRIIIGTDSLKAFKLMKEIYKPLYRRELPVVKCSIPTAVIIKYASNSFLAVKISFINEIAALCDISGGNVSDVSKALGMDGRISPKFLHPGPGFGGSCFPKDTKALVEMSNSRNSFNKVVKAAIESNKLQKKLMTSKLLDLVGPNLKGKKIGILGLAFKAQTDDVRESSSLDMIKFLKKNKCIINVFDPEASKNMKKIFPNINYHESWEEAVTNCNAVIIMTEWNEFRSISLKKLGSLLKNKNLLDTRNIFKTEQLEKSGFKFKTIGMGSN